MNIFGQLIKASFEKVSSDLSDTFEGLFWYNTTSKAVKFKTDTAIKTVVDTDSVQALSNKETDVLTLSQQSTPGVNPAAGKIKKYIKNDKRLYILTESGQEKLVGSEQSVLSFDNQASSPSSPSLGQVKLYSKTDKKLYVKDDDGIEQLVNVGDINLSGDITATSGVTTYNSIVPVSKGGTGLSSLPSKAVLIGDGTSLSSVAPGNSGNVLTSDGTNWISSPSASASQLPVGSVIHSMLTQAQFQTLMGSGWILSDGRSVTGSTYAAVTGLSTVPDMRGRFLRGKNNGSSVNPDGDLALGTNSADKYRSHTHGENISGIDSNGSSSGVISLQNVGAGGVSGAWVPSLIHSQTYGMNTLGQVSTSSSGGNETAPYSTTVNIFIRIN